MESFAQTTGLDGSEPPKRYLWTDAFAVCNFLSLFEATGEERYLRQAEVLTHQVHHVLGRHRPDEERTGWISGLSEEQGEQHPTAGGLRIGKTLNERPVDQPYDSRLEWDRDGQYFHYLTKWMHALQRMSHVTGNLHLLTWAAELDEAAHRSFVISSSTGGSIRMYWKMSIDLSRPLVDSMGHHDPLDGLVTTLELVSDKRLTGTHKDKLNIAEHDFDAMCQQKNWATEDALGIGGLLDAAVRLFQLIQRSHLDRVPLLFNLLHDAQLSLKTFRGSYSLTRHPEQRLAFRELGLAIGLRGLKLITKMESLDDRISELLEEMLPYCSMADEIESFWSVVEHRRVQTWKDHEDINTVMLATALLPESLLKL
ncbi:MAG: hypothetical protein HUJ26_21870 [Planctomycetaceae bacterium]|nr:hypothetical protein [Planctomycetaceae bacterium]